MYLWRDQDFALASLPLICLLAHYLSPTAGGRTYSVALKMLREHLLFAQARTLQEALGRELERLLEAEFGASCRVEFFITDHYLTVGRD